MHGKKLTSRVAVVTSALALTLGLAGTASASATTTGAGAGAASSAAAEAGGARAQGQKCATVVTSNGAGSVDVCWNWYANSQGSYNGRFWGTFHDRKPNDGRWVILHAIWSGGSWKPVATAANGESFSRDYTNLKGLTFRACLTGGYCGSSPS
ncbi:hypothetical protein [Streptomyces sp. URMC 123]|uniref:hypothetical protein n=1 Tax=Streptomyces sp. URMC 123 TaxID=3423403 RepID=UPI003F1C5D70